MKKKYWICDITASGEMCPESGSIRDNVDHCFFHKRIETCTNHCIRDDGVKSGPCIEIELTEKEYKGYILRWKLEGKL
jgi:hypothetical protein